MKRFVKAATLAALLSCAATAPLAFAAPVQPIAFPHEQSPLKPDPAIRYGRLPNGMTYILEANKTPPGTAVVYMRVAAGSMMENADQHGLAHFIEHMAFNGTTNIPEGELKHILERHGFAFGADANAFTSESKTVYTLSAPKSDDETLDTALFIMREVAGNMTLDPAAIDRERGVILGEERLRDGPVTHRNDAWNHQLYGTTRFADYSNPIGKADIIRTAAPALFHSFYDAWYRPELTTLIIVGDFDVDAMEGKIKTRFSDWHGKGPAPAEPDWGKRQDHGVQGFTFAEKGITEEMGATWLRPEDTRHDSVDRKRETLQDALIDMLINRRLGIMAQDPKTAFLQASVGQYGVFKVGTNTYLSLTPKAGQAQAAYEQALGAVQTFRTQGVTPDEIAQLETLYPVILKNARDSYATRNSGGIAGSMLDDLDNDRVSQGLEDGVALFETLKPDAVSSEKLNARIQILFSGDGPVLSHSGETTDGFGNDAMLASYKDLTSKTAATYASAAKKPWPYGDFGAEIKPASYKFDKDFGYSRYVWPNGVVLNFKHTDFAAKQVSVQVDFAGGQLRFDPKTKPPLYLAYGTFLYEGGLGKITATELPDSLLGKTWQMNYGLYGDKAILSGSTVTDDLAVETQVLMAYAIDAAYRPDTFDRYRDITPQNLRNLRTYPEAVRNYNWAHLLNSGDPRFDQTGLEHLDTIRYDDVRDVIRTSLSDTPITITIVGDADEATAVADIGKTFATLPKRPKAAPRFPGADVVAFPPAQRDFTLYHEGRADQSMSVIVWPADDFWSDPRAARGLGVLSSVMSQRLFDELREKQGADYAPQAFANADENFRHNGLVGVISTIKAGGDGDVRTAVATIVADLKSKPITQDELTRVTKPMFEAMDNEANNNGYWQFVLSRISNDPRARADWLVRRKQLEGLTPDYLMSLARTYLRDDTEITMKILPTPPAAQP